MTAPSQGRCPSCTQPASGKFCASCGAPLAPTHCPNCGTAAGAGARFCANCGQNFLGDDRKTATYTPPSSLNVGTWTPWRITTVLGVVAVLAIIWAMVGRGSGGSGATPAGAAPGAPPDISNLSPREQFTRLADRVETSMEAGDTATVVKFFPMVEGAFTNLPPGDQDADARFHLSLLRAQVGHFPSAVAEIDTIVATAPNHLFADYLRAIIADMQRDSTAGRKARAAFRKHYPAEIAAKRPEYDAHKTLLDAFLKTTPGK